MQRGASSFSYPRGMDPCFGSSNLEIPLQRSPYRRVMKILAFRLEFVSPDLRIKNTGTTPLEPPSLTKTVTRRFAPEISLGLVIESFWESREYSIALSKMTNPENLDAY